MANVIQPVPGAKTIVLDGTEIVDILGGSVKGIATTQAIANLSTSGNLSGNLTVTGNISAQGGTLNAGKDAAVGTVNVFAPTAASGHIAIVGANSAGNTTTTITNASQAGARTYTIPDAGASASFVMTAGNQTLTGVLTTATNGLIESAGTIAAAGTVQGNATAIIHNYEAVTAADSTKGVVLPAAVVGNAIVLKNTVSGQTLKVYPAGTDQINALGASNPIVVASVASAMFWCPTAAQWWTTPTLPS